MAGNKAEIVLSLRDQATGTLKEVEGSFQVSMSRMASSSGAIDTIAGKLAMLGGTAAMGGVISSAVEMGIQWEKTAFQMRQTFGASSDAMMAKASEMSSKMGNTFSAQQISYAFTKTADSMKRYGIDGSRYLDLVTRATDVAAAKGMEVKDSIDRIESAIRGEAEASEYLGLTLNDTYMKNMAFNGALKNSWEKLTDNEKALHRYNELMIQSAKYTGAASEAAKTFGGSLSSWWNWFSDDFAKGMANANKSLGQLLYNMQKSKTLQGLGSGMAAAHGDALVDAEGIKGVVEAQNKINMSFSQLRQIDKDNWKKSFSEIKDALEKSNQQLSGLYEKRRQMANEMFYGLDADQRSNTKLRPDLQTEEDYAQRLKQLRGDDKSLAGDIVGLETERVRLLREMDAINLNDPGAMDYYVQMRNRVSEIDESVMIWREQLEKVRAEMEWISEARTAKIDADISSAEANIDKLYNQIDAIPQELHVSIDNRQALNALDVVEARLKQIRALSSMIYQINVMMAQSPAEPFSQGYAKLLDRLRNIPTGSAYTVDVFMQGAEMDAAAAVQSGTEYFKLRDLQAKLRNAYEAVDYYSHAYNGLSFGNPFMAHHYQNTVIPKIQAQIQQQQMALMASVASGWGTSGSSVASSTQGASPSVTFSINTINVNAPGSGAGRDLALSTAESIDAELAALAKSNRSLLRQALGV